MIQNLPAETPDSLRKRNLSLEQWRVLKEAIFPAAETKEAVFMAVDYCRARGLDVFKKPVHIVPVWSKEKGRMVETVWPGISEIRTTAARTGQYAGKTAPKWGPDVTTNLDGVDIIFPEWCEITVHKLVHGHMVPYTAQVFWLETYATAKRDTKAPNAMWRKRPRGQLAKCAEAEALREAFPEEIGGDYTAEEMSGQTLITISDTSNGDAPLPPKREDFEATYPVVTADGEIIEAASTGRGFVAALKGAVDHAIQEQDDVQSLWDANYETLDRARAENDGLDVADLMEAYNNWADFQEPPPAESEEPTEDGNEADAAMLIEQIGKCTSVKGLEDLWRIQKDLTARLHDQRPDLHQQAVDAAAKRKDELRQEEPADA